jgi:shikimate kinase
MEYDLLRNYPWPKGCIISCGGGMPCYFDNIERMLEMGLVVWLNPEISVLTGRLWKERSHRPVLNHLHSPEALEEKLTALLAERKPFYSRADLDIRGNPDSFEFNKTILAAFA